MLQRSWISGRIEKSGFLTLSEYTDKYEQYYETRYKRAEIWQKKILAKLIQKDERVDTLLEFGCGTTRFTRWWEEVGIESAGADISPFYAWARGPTCLKRTFGASKRTSSDDCLVGITLWLFSSDESNRLRIKTNSTDEVNSSVEQTNHIKLMKASFAEKICCPIDKHDLDMKVFVKHEEDDEIIEALLTCPECKRYYPVIYGIPIMTPDEYHEKVIEASTLKKWGLALEESEPDKFLLEEKKI